MKPSDLISNNDWKTISSAYQLRMEKQLTRTMGTMSVTISTEPVNSPVWATSQLVSVIYKFGGMTYRQNFDGVEAAQNALKGW